MKELEIRKKIRENLGAVEALCAHPDPLVRMNCATLLGKMRARVSLPALTRLASSDPDWRVRVNALKALANLPPQASYRLVPSHSADN